MIEDIEVGEISTVIVKDMSRLGRDYLKVGFYTEVLFPKKDVRFIAINNNVDTASNVSNDFTPFINIMNEWYARDTSNKIRTIFNARMKEGKRCSGALMYGYLHHPDDREKIIIDEPAAEVVRRIFRLATEGYGPSQIARILTEDKILNPAAYAEKCHPEEGKVVQYTNPYTWNGTTVNTMLSSRDYLGHTVLGKFKSTKFKGRKVYKTDPKDLLIFENTHEAIIDQETFDLAQRFRKRGHSGYTYGAKQVNKYCGILFCADCGSKMTFKTNISKRKDGTEIILGNFVCGSYRSVQKKCTGHFISLKGVGLIVKTALEILHKQLIENESEFTAKLKSIALASQKQGSMEEKEVLKKAERRMTELDNLIRKLYEDSAKNILSERQYVKLMGEYVEEQNKLEEMISEITAKLKGYSDEDDGSFSPLDNLFYDLEAIAPNHIAVKYYKDYHSGSAKTLKSMQITLAARLEKFNLESIASLSSTDELDLPSMGEKKTALFALIPDNDSSFNFLVSILYTQLFQQLFYIADSKYGGSLPVHCHFVMDEFANVSLPDDFDKILSVMRSRGVSVSIILQNLAQLKA